jgi:hypothetical protein
MFILGYMILFSLRHLWSWYLIGDQVVEILLVYEDVVFFFWVFEVETFGYNVFDYTKRVGNFWPWGDFV